jgi:hypothetical protein
MENFFTFFETYRVGIFVFAASVAFGLGFVVLILQWLLWLFGWGRYAPLKDNEGKPLRIARPGRVSRGEARQDSLQFVVTDFLVKVINDFRNLLALLIVLIFTLVLLVALFRTASLTEMASALQAVMAALGGLVGSIVGYYFGESAVKSSMASPAGGPASGAQPMQQPGQSQPPAAGEPPVQPVSDQSLGVKEVVLPQAALDQLEVDDDEDETPKSR